MLRAPAGCGVPGPEPADAAAVSRYDPAPAPGRWTEMWQVREPPENAKSTVSVSQFLQLADQQNHGMQVQIRL